MGIKPRVVFLRSLITPLGVEYFRIITYVQDIKKPRITSKFYLNNK
jgi:hypothetical protein